MSRRMQRPLLPLTARHRTTSRRALEQAGFGVIDEQQPSFLFKRSVLVTGGSSAHHRIRTGLAIPASVAAQQLATEPLVLDDQALILTTKGS